MKDYTQQMFDDFKPFIKESHWDEFKRNRLSMVEQFGPIVNVLEIYSDDGKTLLERRYQSEHELGTDSGFALRYERMGLQ